MAHLIDGRRLAAELRRAVTAEVAKFGAPPRLVVFLVGDDPASRLYVSLKERAAAEVGVAFERVALPASVTEEDLLGRIRAASAREDVDAVLVQLPLPAPLDAERAVAAIDPAKDADGFHPENLRAIRERRPFTVPGVIEGVLHLIEETETPLEGKRALLLVNSAVFALPLGAALLERGMRVEALCRPFDRATAVAHARASAVVVTALGEPGYVSGDMIADGTVVIDVGTGRRPDGTIAGDVRAEDLRHRDVWLTPVPGGVGPMTVAMLLLRTLELAERRRGR